MKSYLKYIFLFLLFLFYFDSASAQIRPRTPNGNKGDVLDSLRKLDDERQDTIIYSARYIKYTNLHLLNDSTITLPLDTSHRNFENVNPVNQPTRPTVNLGGVGLPYREMLFTPTKEIGFQPGFHAFDAYLLTQDSLRYYRARAPYTELFYSSGGRPVQLFKATHSQNVTKGWNVGANYFRNGSEGYYRNQGVNHLNAAVFTWYESKNKRYNLLANGLFNTIKAIENGGPVSDTIFSTTETLGTNSIPVKLGGTNDNRTEQTWKQKGFFFKQFYYLGRIDSLKGDSLSGSILPTQRVSHAFSYNNDLYKFYNNQADIYGVFPYQTQLKSFDGTDDGTNLVVDSTVVKKVSNELMYSFYLRGKSVKFLKNELKLDVGIQHDLYWYDQMNYHARFQNVTVKAKPGYRFSDRVYIEGDLQQIVQGRNAGDFLYEARSSFLLSNTVGRIILGAYSQNKSPEQMFERVNYHYHQWQNSFDRSKVNNLNFSYHNSKLKTHIRADYYLLSNYLYLQGASIRSQSPSEASSGYSEIVPGDISGNNTSVPLPNVVVPMQESSTINLLKVSLKKDFKFGKFNLENFIVYQKTDYQDLLRTPELYTYHSLYFTNKYFKVLDADIGFDVRYNTPFAAPSYAININQFYNGPEVEFSNYPVANVWLRATLNRANLFVKYDYANQGLFNKGYYTVNRYPMQDAALMFGVSWKFYD